MFRCDATPQECAHGFRANRTAHAFQREKIRRAIRLLCMPTQIIVNSAPYENFENHFQKDAAHLLRAHRNTVHVDERNPFIYMNELRDGALMES